MKLSPRMETPFEPDNSKGAREAENGQTDSTGFDWLDAIVLHVPHFLPMAASIGLILAARGCA